MAGDDVEAMICFRPLVDVQSRINTIRKCRPELKSDSEVVRVALFRYYCEVTGVRGR